MRKQLKQLLLVFGSVVAGLILSTLLQNKVSAFQPGHELMGTSLTLQDANGPYATIQRTGNTVQFSLLDTNKNTRASITVSPNGPVLTLLDENKLERVKTFVDTTGSSFVALMDDKKQQVVVMSQGRNAQGQEGNAVQVKDDLDDFAALSTLAHNSLVSAGHAEEPFHVILRRNVLPETSGGKMLGVFVSDGDNPPRPETYKTWLGANTRSPALASATPICAAPGVPPSTIGPGSGLCPGVPTPPQKP